MDTKGCRKESTAKDVFMQKTVASIVTVFFIFSGIPVPASFAATAPVTTDEVQQIVPVVTLEQANAKTPVVAPLPAPSGVAIQNTNPLSSPTPAQAKATPPVITRTTAATLTHLGCASIAEMEPAGYNTVTRFSQTSTGTASFTYNLRNGTGNNRWAGSLVTLPGFFDLTKQDLVISVTDAGASYYKLELKDAAGKRVTIRVNVDGQVTVTNALVQNAGIAGFDATRIKYLAIVVDDPAATTGTVSISTAGLAYTPVVKVPTTAALTHLGGASIAEMEPAGYNTVTSFSQTSSVAARFTYNLSVVPKGFGQRWAGSLLRFTDTFNLTSQDLVIGASDTGSSYYKLELQDINGKRVTLRVNVDGRVAVTNALVQSAGVAGFDATQIEYLAIVVDDPAATTGTISIETAGLEYRPVITAKTTAALTYLGGASIQRIEPSGVITVTSFSQTSAGTARFVYNLGNATGINRWAGALATFSEVFDLTGQNLVIGASDASSSYYKLELTDIAGKRVTLRVNVDGRVLVTNALVQSAAVAGFDATRIKYLGIVVDDPAATTGTISIETAGLEYRPVITATTAAVLTHLGGASIVEMEPAGYNTVTRFSQTSAETASFSYNLWNGTGNNRWAGSLVTFPGVFNLTSQDLVIGASDTGSSYYKLELKDIAGNRVTLRVNVDGRVLVTNALVQSAGVAGFDATRIKYLAIVVDDPAATTGTVSIETRGLVYTPVITGSVPEGWTRAASNANYAYRVYYVPEPHAPSYILALEVMNLMTGRAQEMDRLNTRSDPGNLRDVDILPDTVAGGAAVIYKKVHAAPAYETIMMVQLATGETFARTYGYLYPIRGSLASYSHDAKVMTFNFTSGEMIRVDLTTFQVLPTVPSGWTRAASNVNYAYMVGPLVLDGVRYYQALQVMDLRTAKIQVVTKTLSSQSRVLPEPFVVDISPNGGYVVYQIQGGSPDSKVVQIYNLRDKNYAENLMIEGATVQSITFSGHEVRISTTASATDKRPDGVYVVDVISGADRFVPDVPTGWMRAASNENFAFLTRLNTADPQPGLILEVQDLLNRAVYTVDVASAGDSQISFCDVSRYGGVVIYSVSSSASTTDRVARTVVQKLSDLSRSVIVPAGVSKIRCDIGNSVITLTLEDGSRVWVDGGALKVIAPPVPSGWTRAASNENYAFYIKSGSKVGSYTVQTLQVQDLRTGEIRDVVTTQPPASKTFSQYDVSLDGKAVTYEMNGSMTVQSVTDAAMKWSGVGIPKTISMDVDSVTFTYPDGTKARISTQTFQRILLPVPIGWTRAVSNENFAFKVDGATGRYEQAIYVMNLLTGSSQTVAVRVGYSSPGYSSQDVDVSPNGEYVFYKEIPTSGAQKVIEAYSLAEKRVTGFVLVDHSYYTISKIAFVGAELWVSIVPNRTNEKPGGVYILDLKDGSKRFVPDVPIG